MARIMFPVARMIGGDLYKARQIEDPITKQPVVDRKTGEIKSQFSFGIAIPKGSEQHWSQTEWGALIFKEGFDAYDNMCYHPSFSWKVQDGDSHIPNKKGNINSQRQGYPGNWIIWFTQNWAPKIVDPRDNHEITDKNAILAGYFIQVLGDVIANGTRSQPKESPGVYMNPVAVALIGYGERIISNEVDLSGVQFGGGVMPAGILQTPPSNHPVGAVSDAQSGFPGQPVAQFPGQPVQAAQFPGQPAPQFPGQPVQAAQFTEQPVQAAQFPGQPVAQFPGQPVQAAQFPGQPVAQFPGQPVAQFPGQPVQAAQFPGQPTPGVNPAFLNMHIPGQFPGQPQQQPEQHVMTALAAGMSYEHMQGLGFTDQMLRERGFMQ